MIRHLPAALVAVCTLAAPSLSVSPAAAKMIDPDSPWTRRAAAITPLCRDHPNAPVIGRISGDLTMGSVGGVTYVGCFRSFEECTLWRTWISGQISGRININRCDPR